MYNEPNFNPDFFSKEIKNQLKQKINNLWPDLNNLSLLNLGYAANCFPINKDEPSFSITGHFHSNIQSYASEISPICQISPKAFPFQDRFFDRILYIHDGLICKNKFAALLRSCWETLRDSGKFILLLPNSLSWCFFKKLSLGFDNNGFYFPTLKKMLKQQMFRICYSERILFLPSSIMNLFSSRVNQIVETIGQSLIPFLGGFHLIEVEKDLYATIPLDVIKRRYLVPQKLFLNLRKDDPA